MVLRRVKDVLSGRADLSPQWRRRLRPARWGNLRRFDPVSGRYGYDRGTPVDRRHIEVFLARHAGEITGRVLEVKDARYATRFGRACRTVDVVDIDPGNAGATIVADLCSTGSLPKEAFDCAIVTQTLMYVADPDAAVANLWQSIAPGGTLLITVATTARCDPDAAATDRWRFTPVGLETVVRRSCPGAVVEADGGGNLALAIAYLHGLAVEDLPSDVLDRNDPRFPVVATARVHKPALDRHAQAVRSPR